MSSQDPHPPGNRVVRFADVCTELGISKATLRKLVQDGEGPKVLRISERCLGVRRSDLEEWIAQRSDKLLLGTPKR